MMKRNLFLLFVLVLSISCKSTKQPKAVSSPWNLMKTIEAQIVVPAFKNKTYNVIAYGAIGDGKTDNTRAINSAILNCSNEGGGKVLVPSGKYYTGPINLQNNVNLHLAEGAEILFSTNPKDYPIVHTSFEGTEVMNYSPLVYAYQKTNVALTGKGILNGQASNDNWWFWCGAEMYGWKKGMPNQKEPQNLFRLMDMAEEGVPVSKRVFGEDRYLRPTFIDFFECTNVLLEGIKIVKAPFWVIHPMKSTNVTIDGVTVESHGPNNDGCDPEYSKNVIIKNCVFNTGDDCIAIKSGRNADGRRVAIPSENIIVRNCKMIDGHGGVVIGSEISAGVRNVFVENCLMDSPNLDRAIRIKSNSKRGGLVENVYVRNLEVGQVKEAVLKINMFYGIYGKQEGNFIPEVRNVFLENVKVKNGGKFGILANGYKELPIQNIRFMNVTIDKVDKEYSIDNVVGLQFINTRINGNLMQSP
ncbi:glycoside hydrolase family 28 protein [Flavobacterium faecale]|uniref:glycoside hydrolase family 28 protein n=1 Tax=Flavobacterium faecale TaxID=1355330 RepID=UPI003AAB471B